MKKTVTLFLTVLLTICLSATVYAVPYQNYTVTESGTFEEPHAYQPDRVINSG